VILFDPADGPARIPPGKTPFLYLLLVRGFLSVISFMMLLATTLVAVTSPSPSDRLFAPMAGLLFAVLGIGGWWLTSPATYGLMLDETGLTCRYPFRERHVSWRDVRDIVAISGSLNVVALVDIGLPRMVVVQGWYKAPAADIIATMQAFRAHFGHGRKSDFG